MSSKDTLPKGSKTKACMTSLPLQVCLHYNIVLAPFLFSISIASFIYKYPHLSTTFQVILVAVHIVHAVIEAARLIMGYIGNLGEKIPALSGFWITSLLLQLPISIFLCITPEVIPLPAEIFLYAFHILFLVAEILLGYVVIRNIGAYHVRQFKAAIAEEEEREENEEQVK